jgi:hypothetical protein
MVMIKPIVVDDIFEINDHRSITSFDNNVLVVDNWYKDIDAVMGVVNNLHAPRWKVVNELTTRNFKDYYDCRPLIQNQWHGDKYYEMNCVIMDYIREYFKVNVSHPTTQDVLFNMYRNINKDVSNTMQHVPHVDGEFNAVIYLDDISSGGTAVYEYDAKFGNGDLAADEGENVLYDIDGLNYTVIPAKQNRMVLYPGNIWHGGYISNHNDYVENWRINQVIFFR